MPEHKLLAVPARVSKVWGRPLTAALLTASALPYSVSDVFAYEDQPGVALQEVVVTSQRRTEKLQDVPISVAVFDEAARSQANLNSLTEVSELVPTLHVSDSGRSNNLYIRGIGSGDNQSFDQSVGTFIDDIYHGRSRTSSATLMDLERIEVLKGPQSTFFGNNAIAGALNIITKKPGDTFDASARALYSPDGNQYAFETAVGGPINDVIRARAAVTVNGMSGWLFNPGTDHRIPDENDKAARVIFEFRPTEGLDATVKLEASRDRNSGGFPAQLVGCPPPPPYVAAGFCKVNIALHTPTGLDGDSGESPGQGIRLDTEEGVLTVNYSRWEHTFTSVTGFTHFDYLLNLDTDGTPLTLLNVQAPERYRQFSEEFRVTSPTGQLIEYMAGGYFQNGHTVSANAFDYAFLTPSISAAPPFKPLIPDLPLGQVVTFMQREHTYSVFGSVSLNLTDSLKVTGGIRGSNVKKDLRRDLYYGTASRAFGGVVPLSATLAPLAQAFANAAALGIGGTLNAARADDAWTPSLNVQYKLLPAVMTYASYANGFKAGGFNGADTSGVQANLPYSPERVNAYEAGIKSEWFGGSVLLNGDVFRSEYSNQQVAVNSGTPSGGFVSVVNNAGSSISQGIELESQWVIDREFRIGLDATYLDAYYGRYPNAGPTAAQQLAGHKIQNLSGQPTAFAPRLSGRLRLTYDKSLPRDFRLTTAIDAFFSDSYFIKFNDDDFLRQGDYVRLDGRLSLGWGGGRWAFDLIGKNLTNRNILIWGVNQPTAPGSFLLQREQPRNVAIQIRYRFD